MRLTPAIGAASLLLVLSTGCYHATVETGLTPSAQTVEKPWANGWLFGLVPPSPVETMAKCQSGVAKVETQLSFANQLANFLTGGIYTPMSIKVTCAERRTSDAPVVRDTDVERGLAAAVQLLQETSAPVYLETR